MLVVDKKTFMFNVREIHSAEYPFDIEGYDLLTFQYCKNKVDVKGFKLIKEHFTTVIDLTQDLDAIWQNMNKTNRHCVNNAKKEGVNVRISENYKEFYKIYKSFIKKKGTASLFRIFGVGSVDIETMRKYGTLLIAEYNGEFLGGLIYLEDQSNINYWIGASKRLDVDKEKAKLIGYANRLIHWEAIKYAKEKGIKEYDFGGIFSDEEAEKDKMKMGIRFFKLSFGGDRVTRYQYQKIYSKRFKMLYYLYNLNKKIRETG
jgi:lipid II:glycine glycyltransferase (peptidoglycan interpeptide bridge formation enzyme)